MGWICIRRNINSLSKIMLSKIKEFVVESYGEGEPTLLKND
jgi:hypothetical protein